MIKKNQRLLNFVNVVSDAFLLFAAYFFAVFVRFEVLNGHKTENLLAPVYIAIAIFLAVSMIAVYILLQLYSPHRYRAIGKKVGVILVVNTMGALLFTAICYVLRLSDFPRIAIFIYWILCCILVSGKHLAVKLILHYCRKKGYNQKHIIVVGNGHLAKQYMEDIKKNPQYGVSIDGYVSAVEKPGLGKCLGSYEQLCLLLEKYDPDELVVALEPHEVIYMKSVLEAADKEGAKVNIIPFFNDYLPPCATMDVVGQTKLINMRATPLDNLGWALLKRGMDIVGSLVLLLLFSPIMLLIALGVRLSSPGPVIFKQKRIGLNKKPFTMLKFRSMRVNEAENTAWSSDTDPRKTAFGTFIRKTSLDELPQLFNVLIGEMSLVGPRPEIPYHVRHFREEVPLYLVRQQVRPGITGWAQVNGFRGDTDINERIQHDIWYIENWTLWLDIKILLKTVFGGMFNNEK